jgi:LytS/YehU family sensor histidine kinase
MILLFAACRYVLEEIIYFKFTGFHNYFIESPRFLYGYLFDSFYYTFRFCLYSGIVYLLFRHIENKDKLYQLNIKHEQAQLLALKSQISPHFLFNTLNNFYEELYDEKPKTAKDILKLSNLLRYVTYEASEDFMPLEKEVNFIKDYLYFFRRRYEANFYVDLTVKGKLENQEIPSLILIHLVENVCKHGIINDKNRAAKISINIKNNELEVSTENYINTSEKHMESGIGADNIKKRLDVIYKGNYTLEYKTNATIFKTYLKLPL